MTNSIRKSIVTTILAILVLWSASTTGDGFEQSVKRVEIVAKRFKFIPSKIKLEEGTRLEIVLSSRDVVHGFHLIDTEIDVRIPARGQGEVRLNFDPPGPGKYRFVCSHSCGAGHAQMRGVIEVKSRPDRADRRETGNKK